MAKQLFTVSDDIDIVSVHTNQLQAIDSYNKRVDQLINLGYKITSEMRGEDKEQTIHKTYFDQPNDHSRHEVFVWLRRWP